MSRAVVLSDEEKVRRAELLEQLGVLNDFLNPDHTEAMHHRRGEIFDELKALGLTRDDLAEATRARGVPYTEKAVDYAVSASRARNASPQRPAAHAVDFVDRVLAKMRQWVSVSG
jgi:hypothetical protein